MLRRLLLILTMFCYGITFGEGWTKKAGTGYYALDFRFLNTSKYHNSEGDNVDIDGVVDLAINLYSEYGLTDNLTIKLNFPFYKILKNDQKCPPGENCLNKENKGIGDIDLGLRYKLGTLGNTTFGAGLTFGIPINADDIYGKGSKLALSDGEFNQIMSLEAGHSLYPLPAYISGSVKFNNRDEGFSDQFYFGAEGGYKLSNNFLLNLRVNFLKSLNNGDKKNFDDLIPVLANNQEYLAIRFGAFYNFYKNYGISFTSDFGIYAKNILSAPVFSIGFFIK